MTDHDQALFNAYLDALRLVEQSKQITEAEGWTSEVTDKIHGNLIAEFVHRVKIIDERERCPFCGERAVQSISRYTTKWRKDGREYDAHEDCIIKFIKEGDSKKEE